MKNAHHAAGWSLKVSSLVLFALLGCLPLRAADTGPIRIVLENSFIDEFADRGTIAATFTIDKAHKKPNTPAKDGDMHIAGRAPQIGLPCVAELMNAKFEKEELTMVKTSEGTGNPVDIVGAWRIWCEHAGTTPQKQKRGTIGTTVFETTNPPHVFEIHPITSMGTESSLTSWHPIDGFKAKDAHDAFVTYENVGCEIIPKPADTEIRTSMAGYNYVEFVLEREDPQGHVMQDGSRSIFISARDLDGDLLVRKVRAVFVKDSEPFEKLGQLQDGGRLHVLALPRISLALVKWRVENKDNPEFPGALKWNLPYEMIIVGVYPDEGDGD